MAHQVSAIVLAAGLGTRMKSHKPKVLHIAAGRPLLDYVFSGLSYAGVASMRVVVGYGSEQIKQHLWGRPSVEFFTQEKQLGTADAVKSAQVENILTPSVLICNGDHPLITGNDYLEAIQSFNDSRCDLLVVSSDVKRPKGFGRIVRDSHHKLIKIVEEKDASETERSIREVNSGLYLIKTALLKELLPKINNSNAKKEFYLTDIIKLALSAKKKVDVAKAHPRVCRGVNDQVELALASKALYRRKIKELMEGGVVIVDPFNTYIEGDVEIGAETVVGQGTVISSGSKIGKNCIVDPYCSIRASTIADRAEVRWGTIIDQSQVGENAVVGPYARLRPESIVEREAHVGNFVELKKTRLGVRAKANHLTYLGDAEIGEETNIGCGTITCNYAVDRKKYKTKIGKNVFVGSDTQFVAPINVGDGAIIASGSTITEDVPAKALAIARSKQTIKPDYTKE